MNDLLFIIRYIIVCLFVNSLQIPFDMTLIPVVCSRLCWVTTVYMFSINAYSYGVRYIHNLKFESFFYWKFEILFLEYNCRNSVDKLCIQCDPVYIGSTLPDRLYQIVRPPWPLFRIDHPITPNLNHFIYIITFGIIFILINIYKQWTTNIYIN